MIEVLANAIKAHAVALDQTAGQVRYGTIASVNTQNSTARVILRPDGVLTGWLPMVSQWVGAGWGIVCPPSPGDQVVLLPQEGDMEQGIIIGRIYSRKETPPNAPAGELWLVHQTGTSLKLCNDGTIRVTGDLHVDGDIFDRIGALSRLRANYNSHVHQAGPNIATGLPIPEDPVS